MSSVQTVFVPNVEEHDIVIVLPDGNALTLECRKPADEDGGYCVDIQLDDGLPISCWNEGLTPATKTDEVHVLVGCQVTLPFPKEVAP